MRLKALVARENAAIEKVRAHFRQRKEALLAEVRLPGNCNHVDRYETFWHHGYGNMLPKLDCMTCGAVNHWPSLKTDPREWTSRADYERQLREPSWRDD